MTKTYLQQLLTLPTVEYALLSPDGCWIAFMWYRIHANMDVFLVPADGSILPIALTHTSEFTKLISWTPDSRAVIVAEDHNRDERYRLFRVDLARPGEMAPLTEDHPPYFLRGGEISPDGAYLYYGANYNFDTQQILEETWIYRHDLQTGQRLPLARPHRPAYTEPELNHTGTHLIYARKDRHPSGRQYHLVDIEGKQDQEVLNFGAQAKVFARWFPDGENLLVLAEACSGEHGAALDYQRLGVYHVPSERMRWLVDDPRRSIEGAWVSPDGTVIINEVYDASLKPTYFELSSEQEHAFPALPGNLRPLGRVQDGAWVGVYYSSTSPAELVRFDLNAQSPNDLCSLTRVWEQVDLDVSQLTPAESLKWSSVDGLTVQGWLYRARPNPCRAVIMVHGGPTYHSEDQLKPVIHYLVSQGYNVLDVNFRGSTGFGLQYRDAIKEDGWGGREQDDIATGAETLLRLGLADPGKICVFGTSYGGYSAWCQITHSPTRLIAAAIPICGMTDLEIDYQTTRPDLRPYSEEMMGGSPDEIPERYFMRSPINYVQNIRGKLLIVQGGVDPNVTPENMHQVIQRLQEHEIPFELLVFEDEGHGIAKPANQERLYMRMAEFLDGALTGEVL